MTFSKPKLLVLNSHSYALNLFWTGVIAFIEELKTNVSMQSINVYLQYKLNRENRKFSIYGEVSAGVNVFMARKKSTDTNFKVDSNNDGVFDFQDENATKSQIEPLEPLNLSASEPIVHHRDFSPSIGIGLVCRYNFNSHIYLIGNANYFHGFEASYFDNGSQEIDQNSIENWNIVKSNTSTARLSLGVGVSF